MSFRREYENKKWLMRESAKMRRLHKDVLAGKKKPECKSAVPDLQNLRPCIKDFDDESVWEFEEYCPGGCGINRETETPCLVVIYTRKNVEGDPNKYKLLAYPYAADITWRREEKLERILDMCEYNVELLTGLTFYVF